MTLRLVTPGAAIADVGNRRDSDAEAIGKLTRCKWRLANLAYRFGSQLRRAAAPGVQGGTDQLQVSGVDAAAVLTFSSFTAATGVVAAVVNLRTNWNFAEAAAVEQTVCKFVPKDAVAPAIDPAHPKPAPGQVVNAVERFRARRRAAIVAVDEVKGPPANEAPALDGARGDPRPLATPAGAKPVRIPWHGISVGGDRT